MGTIVAAMLQGNQLLYDWILGRTVEKAYLALSVEPRTQGLGFMGPRGEPTATILLNGRCIRVSYKFISLYLLIAAVLRILQRTFFEQWTVANQKFTASQRAKNKCQWSSEPHVAYLYCHTHIHPSLKKKKQEN